MNDATPNPPVTPKSALATIKEWKELIASVALTLTGVFGGLVGKWFSNESVKIASSVLAVVSVAVGAYVVHRKQKRQREQARRERIWAERQAQRKPQSAFRSLAPFEERDELPGKDR